MSKIFISLSAAITPVEVTLSVSKLAEKLEIALLEHGVTTKAAKAAIKTSLKSLLWSFAKSEDEVTLLPGTYSVAVTTVKAATRLSKVF